MLSASFNDQKTKYIKMPVQFNKSNLEQEMEDCQVLDYQAMIKLDPSKIITKAQAVSIIGKPWPWEYRGEGNSNIVITLQDELTVIRLSKVNIGDSSTEAWDEQKKKIEREVIYANFIFGRLIGKDYVGQVKIVEVNPNEFKELNQLLKSKRPLNRLHKELGLPYGTIRADFARISHSHVDYCIEIKPKQGWWSKSLLGKPTDLCTFCLNQFLKINLVGKTTKPSNYCPLDLFSGNATRMIGAVISLMEQPQNNFRIFRNGHLVYGDHNYGAESLQIIIREWFSTCQNKYQNELSLQNGCSIDERATANFIYITCLALLTPAKLRVKDTTSDDILHQIKESLQQKPYLFLTNMKNLPSSTIKEKCNDASSNLPDGCILSRLLVAQKLGKWAGEMAYKLYPKICPVHNGNAVQADCPNKKCGQEDKWLDQIDNYANILNELECLSIEHYLLAATAKDCSIMIAFSQVQSPENENSPKKRCKLDTPNYSNITQVEDLYGNQHKVKVGVADLDPKPVTSISRHYFRDLGMYDAFLASQPK